MKHQAFYRHYKDKPYRALSVCRHSETLEELVLYEALYPNDLGPLWVRPKNMFEGRLSDGVTERFRLDTKANHEHVVQRQLDAYNDGDIERFVACFAQDVRVENDNRGSLILAGRDAMKNYYGKMFSDYPNLHCKVVKRIESGSTVIDEELIMGHPKGDHIKAVAIYTIAENIITRVRFL
jgi:hypothetical protein